MPWKLQLVILQQKYHKLEDFWECTSSSKVHGHLAAEANGPYLALGDLTFLFKAHGKTDVFPST
jgi:hypothetical protein